VVIATLLVSVLRKIGYADRENYKFHLHWPGDPTHRSILATMPAAGWFCLIRMTGRHSMDFAGGLSPERFVLLRLLTFAKSARIARAVMTLFTN